MSDPMQVQSVEPDAGGNAPELPLSSDPEFDQGGGGADPEPAAAPDGGPATASTPDWFERSSKARETTRSGYKERQRQREEERRRLREELAAVQQRDTETKRLLMESLELVRGQQKPEAAPVPDPILEPEAYREWLRTVNREDFRSELQPALEYIEQQRLANEQAAQERALVEEQQEFVRTEMDKFSRAAAEYARDYPDLAEGATERFKQGQGLLERCCQRTGRANPQLHASKILFGIAEDARANGDNEVLVLDQFLSALYYEVSQDLVQAGFLEQPLYPMGGAAPTPMPGANGNGHQPQRPNPAAAEAARVEQVRQRTRAAGSVAPREPASGQFSKKTEAQQLFEEGQRVGAVDWGQVRAAALRDTGGDMKEAAIVLARLQGRR